MAKERIQWLDIVKGIAILGVVLQHTFQRLMTYYNLNDDVVLNYLNRIVGSCSMELFFFISGVIFFLQKDRYQSDPKWFVKARFIDLMIPYLILGPLIWVGKFTLSSMVKNQVSVDDLLDMFVTPIAFMWFIYILFFVEIIALFINRWAAKCYEVTLAVLLVISMSSSFVPFGVSADIFHRVPFYLFWYYLGGCLVLYKDRLSFLDKRHTSLALCVLWIVGFSSNFFLNLGIFSVIVTTLGVFTWISMYMNKSITNILDKWMHYLGKRTMYIYILNPLIINGTWQILKNLGWGGYLLITMLCFVFGTLIIACTIANIAPKIPPIEFIFSPRKYIIKKK